MRATQSIPRQAALLAGIFLLAGPAHAHAQGRRAGAVHVVRPVRSVVYVGGGYYPGFYDPFWFSDPWYGYYGPWGYPPPYPYHYYRMDPGASLRLEVKPQEAEVYVDGYYAGIVDDFDGVFQRLPVTPGEHEIELYLDGYRSVRQKVMASRRRLPRRMAAGPGRVSARWVRWSSLDVSGGLRSATSDRLHKGGAFMTLEEVVTYAFE